MFNKLFPVLLFIGIGIGWRYVRPMGIKSEQLQRPLFVLIQSVLLPLLVFFTLWRYSLDRYTGPIMLNTVLITGIALAAGWGFFKFSKLPTRIKGALVMAGAFGAVSFVGFPVAAALFKDTLAAKISVEYLVMANVLILFTAGTLVMKQYGGVGIDPLRDFAKEPIIWAAALGLLLNLTGAGIPRFLSPVSSAVLLVLPPIMLVTLGLSLTWKPDWNKLILPGLAPVAALKLVLIPLILWGLAVLSAKTVGKVGHTGLKVMMLSTLTPGLVLGLILCERHKFATAAYTAAMTFVTALAVIAVPVWMAIL